MFFLKKLSSITDFSKILKLYNYVSANVYRYYDDLLLDNLFLFSNRKKEVELGDSVAKLYLEISQVV